MKKSLVVCLALGVAWQIASPVHAQNQNFGLLNETGHVITAVYLSPHGDTSWYQNRLSSPLDNDEIRTFDFSQSGFTKCLFDFAIVLDNGQRWEETTGYNLCQIGAIGVGPDGQVVTANANN